ncbi:uncharacterized protein MELLADRAFT_66963 [Melampsora larici-populina 98AG31]|uniref:Uncharacterized protein n=1 Tax=Melampsora larici-populina (strain 98AG31 / pathotype 3-4-7) TaxID=747676 RepID=F4S1A3_MELLP|nr:uncharacterized protein MELLADRAFT_66963 [Melampsora larici-populina 98AG31]EGG01596.1 hypothetical protein MELLADRAFT_66963 [Melampsora larici-populina 98AG31]
MRKNQMSDCSSDSSSNSELQEEEEVSQIANSDGKVLDKQASDAYEEEYEPDSDAEVQDKQDSEAHEEDKPDSDAYEEDETDSESCEQDKQDEVNIYDDEYDESCDIKELGKDQPQATLKVYKPILRKTKKILRILPPQPSQ